MDHGAIGVSDRPIGRIATDTPFYGYAGTFQAAGDRPLSVLGVPTWWGPAGASAPLPTYELRAQVQQEGAPLPNVRVALFFRRLNTLIDMKVSDENGNVVFRNLMPGPQAYYMVALDPKGAPLQNSLIWDRLSSTPST